MHSNFALTKRLWWFYRNYAFLSFEKITLESLGGDWGEDRIYKRLIIDLVIMIIYEVNNGKWCVAQIWFIFIVFQNKSSLLQDQPILTACFLDTFPVWVSCGFLWTLSLPFIVFMRRRASKPLPFSYIHVIRIVSSFSII